MASLQQIAAFGQANPQNPGGGLAIGQRAAEMRNQNRLAELARQDAQEQQEYARQRLQQQEQHDFARRATESMLSAPPEQRPQMYQGFLQEAQRRGYDISGDPTEYSDEFLHQMAGATGAQVPGAGQDSVRFGQINPRDFTTESLARFQRSGDFRDLERHANRQFRVVTGEDGRDRLHVLDPATGGYVPATAEQAQAVMGQAGGSAPPGGLNTTVSRTPEEEAALVEAAKLRGRQTAEADPVEGSELHRSREAATARAEAARRNAIDYARTVTQDVGIALDELNRMGPLSSMDNMAGGRLAQWRSNIERTPEYNVRQFVESALSNVTLDTMNRMRETSPAGATGFGNMSERQMQVIRSVLGQWNPGLPKEHQEYILHRIGNFYMDVVMGTEEERAQAVRDGRMTPEENEAIQALYYPETRDVRGQRLQNEAPPVNDRGWQLMQDAAGNRAYVGPNGEIEEL